MDAWAPFVVLCNNMCPLAQLVACRKNDAEIPSHLETERNT